jgi:hypothetical protein
MERVRVLRRVLMPLRPYLEDVVLIGGWVPFLYLDRVGKAPMWSVRRRLLVSVLEEPRTGRI